MTSSDNVLRVIPLGGLGEIGKNMMVLEYGDAIVIIDCGVMFPTRDMFGVDLVLPDTRYLKDRRDAVRGIVLTHGHEDHIGALPHILPDLNVPVYGTALTMGLVSVKMKDSRGAADAELRTVEPGEEFSVGPFEITLFRVNHSIPDATGVIIRTPVGTVVHTGDFKIDHTAVDGQVTDFHRIAEVGDEGVLLLLADSTYADTAGYTPSEAVVGKALNRLIGEAEGRVIVASFASLISRIQQVITAAVIHDRRVGVIGRSMVDNVRLATGMGYLQIPDGTLLQPNQLQNNPPEKTVIMTTGAQGEPTSALVRMANSDHPQVKIEKGDTVIISSNPIPGNEAEVARTIDNLFMLGAEVMYSRIEEVHVRGHASQEELKLMLRLTRPEFFVPIHGDYRHLVHHARLAASVGVDKENIFVMTDGDTLELTEDDAGLVGNIGVQNTYVDGLRIGDVDNVVLRDRAALSKDGVIVVIVSVDQETGDIVGDLDLMSRGFIDSTEGEELLKHAGRIVARAFERSPGRADAGFIHSKVRESLGQFIFQETRRRPMILPMVVEL
jgi:ribonuclease J